MPPADAPSSSPRARDFSARAYDELSIDDIAAEAGVAKGLLYFGSKRGFYVP